MYDLDEGLLDRGDKDWTSMLETLAVCESNDNWPGYAQAEVPLVDDADDPVHIVMPDGEVIVQ